MKEICNYFYIGSHKYITIQRSLNIQDFLIIIWQIIELKNTLNEFEKDFRKKQKLNKLFSLYYMYLSTEFLFRQK